MHLVKLLVAAGAIVAGGLILGGTAHADDITDGMRSATVEVILPVDTVNQELAAVNSMADGMREVSGLPVTVTDFPTATSADTTVTGDGQRSVALAP